MGVYDFKTLSEHVGHLIQVVTYGDPAVNVACECLDCNEVLLDFDKDIEYNVVEYCPICGSPMVFESTEEGIKQGIHEYEICVECERHVCHRCVKHIYEDYNIPICLDCIE